MVYDHDGGYFHRHDNGPLEWKKLLESELSEMNSIDEAHLPFLIHSKPLPFGYSITVGERFRSSDGRSALRIHSTCWPTSYPPLKRLDLLVQILRDQSFELTVEEGDPFDVPCFSFSDDSPEGFDIDSEHAIEMSGFVFSQMEKIRTSGPSDMQICRAWAFSPPDVRLNTELLVGYSDFAKDTSHRVWLHEIKPDFQSSLEEHDELMNNVLTEYRDSLFNLLCKVDNFGELGSKWWKNLCLSLDEAGVSSTLDLNALIRLNIHHSERSSILEDSERYRSAALRKLAVGLRLSQKELLGVFLKNSPYMESNEVEEFDPEHRLLIVTELLELTPVDKMRELMKYSSVLDDQQMSILITSIDFAELSSLENSIDSIQNLRTRNVDLFHQLLQNQLHSESQHLVHSVLSHLSSKRYTPVLYTNAPLLALLSKFEATEQHILVNPQLFSKLVFSPKDINNTAFQQQLVHAQHTLLLDGQSKQLSIAESMIIQTPRVLMNKHHASNASVLLWLQLMQERMSETQCALFAADLANLHLDYRTNKFLYWIFNNSTDSELTQFCKSHYGTEAYAKMIATVDDSYFEQYLSKKHPTGLALPLSASKKTIQQMENRDVLVQSFRFTILKTPKERLKFLSALVLFSIFAFFPILTYFAVTDLLSGVVLPYFGSFSNAQGNLTYLLGNVLFVALLSMRWLRRRKNWKTKLKEVLS
jgi:cell division protein ZapA (FtsZ GTPase activity inhibitor)